MRKVFCDRDGRECESRIGNLHLVIIHQTNQGQPVGDDELKPVELCGPCLDELFNFLGNAAAVVPRKMSFDSDIDRCEATEIAVNPR